MDARLLRLLDADIEERCVLRAELVADMTDGLHGDGPMPDTATARGRLAAQLYLDEVVLPALAGELPEKQAALTAAYVARIGYLPEGLVRDRLTALQPGQPVDVRTDAVRHLRDIDYADDTMFGKPPDDVQRFVNTWSQAAHETDADASLVRNLP